MSPTAIVEQNEAIAIVDDDPAALQAMQFLLQVEGFGVRAYAGGRAFLDAAYSPGIACAIIDQNMPGLSGIEVVEQLRQSGMRLPVILVTATSSAKLVARAKVAGVDCVIEKPIFGSGLTDAIRACLAPNGDGRG